MRKLPANSHSSGPTATAPVVDFAPPTALMAGANAKIMGGGGIRAQIVGDQLIGGEPAFFQEFAHQFQRGMLVSLGLDEHVEDLALAVDGAPQIDHAAGNLEINLVKMPSRVRLGATFAQICRDHRPEMVHPAPNRFVRDGDSALRQQIFNVAEAQSESKIQLDRLLNDRRREAITVVVDFLHPPGYRATKEVASSEPA